MKKILVALIISILLFVFVGTVLAATYGDNDKGVQTIASPSLSPTITAIINSHKKQKRIATPEFVIMDAQGNIIPSAFPFTPISGGYTGRMCAGAICPSPKPPVQFPATYTSVP